MLPLNGGIPHAPVGDGGQTGIVALSVGNAKIGTPSKSGKISGIFGCDGLHPKIWNDHGERRSLLNGIGHPAPQVFFPTVTPQHLLNSISSDHNAPNER